MKLKIIFTSLFLGMLLLFASVDVSAQCAMCKRVAETNMEDNQTSIGKNLNKGILYLLSVPYILGGIGLFAWYSERKKLKIKNEQLKTTNASNS